MIQACVGWRVGMFWEGHWGLGGARGGRGSQACGGCRWREKVGVLVLGGSMP